MEDLCWGGGYGWEREVSRREREGQRGKATRQDYQGQSPARLNFWGQLQELCIASLASGFL